MDSPTDHSSETATCESCGKVGKRETFYSTTKRFCGVHCSHSFSAKHRKQSQQKAILALALAKKKRRLSSAPRTPPVDVKLPLVLPSEMERREYSSSGFDWGKHLLDTNSEAAPVHLFPHAQMSTHWADIDKGVKLEVLNLDCPVPTKVYWIAQVVKVAGYKAALRYEGFGDDDRCDFWCNLCTHDVHAVGWCATIGKPLVPPKTIQFKHSNWKSFLVHRLTGAKTLPNDFQQRVVQSMECPFQINMRLEVMDKTQISRMRIGIVEEVIGGRLRLRYEDSDEPNDDFWCHAGSPLIHHIGWSEKVGHRILVASKDYKNVPGFVNSKVELFAEPKAVKSCGFKVGMKLEAIDPLNLSHICVATIQKVLKNGYLMIGIDGSEAINGSDWFSYHCTSPSIFPVGFCSLNDIALSPPRSHRDNFSWENYLLETQSEAAPVNLFSHEDVSHGFNVGMKLEAVDLMEPRLLCVATVSRIVGRLLRIHFDGWDAEYDQWVDSQSSDIYPVGWCELVGYELQPPHTAKPNVAADATTSKKKSKPKGQSFLGKKRRKRFSVAGRKSNTGSAEEEPAVQTLNKNIEISPSTEAPTSLPDQSEKPTETAQNGIEKKQQNANDPANELKEVGDAQNADESRNVDESMEIETSGSSDVQVELSTDTRTASRRLPQSEKSGGDDDTETSASSETATGQGNDSETEPVALGSGESVPNSDRLTTAES